MKKTDYKKLEGKCIGIYEILKCINPEENSYYKIKYRVKCTKCGYEKIVSKSFLSSAKNSKPKSCENCRTYHKIWDFKVGEVYGKYKILEYLGLHNNSTRFYRVKCLRCGWEGNIDISTILTSVKSNNNNCRHNTLRIGETVNRGRYLIVGKITNINLFKDYNFRYIVRCNDCNRLLYLTVDKINRCVAHPKYSHRAYFYQENFDKNDYILDESLLKGGGINKEKENVSVVSKINENEKEIKIKMSENKLINYIVEKNKSKIIKTIDDSINLHKEEFISRGMEFLAKELEDPKGDQLDLFISDTIESERFFKYVFCFNDDAKETQSANIVNDIVEETPVEPQIQDDQFNRAVKNIFYYVSQKQLKWTTKFLKSIINGLVGNNEEIIDKMIKMNMLKPIEDDYIVDKNRINNYIEEG